jgi:hypothetical protein
VPALLLLLHQQQGQDLVQVQTLVVCKAPAQLI